MMEGEMQYAIVEDGVVVNVAIGSSPLTQNWVASETAGIGDRYIGGEFIPPDPPQPPVPEEVTRFQALAALHHAGLLQQAEQIVTQSDMVVQLAWVNAQTFKRKSPTILALAPSLGMSESDLDDLFRAAILIDA